MSVEILFAQHNRIQLRAELDGEAVPESPKVVRSVTAALTALEHWFERYPGSEFEATVISSMYAPESHVTSSRYLALYFVAIALGNLLAVRPRRRPAPAPASKVRRRLATRQGPPG